MVFNKFGLLGWRKRCPREAIEIVNGNITLLDLPNAVAANQTVIVAGTNKGSVRAGSEATGAVDITARSRRMIVHEVDHQVRSDVLTQIPRGPQHVQQSMTNTRQTLKRTERGADIPNAIFGPDSHEDLFFALIKTMAVVGDQTIDIDSALQSIDTL